MRDKIIYWVSTLWLSLGMLSTGVVQVLNINPEQAFTAHMAYPPYFLTMLGVWKIAGVVALLIPKFPIVKEWAYAGFVFVMSGAVFSHIAVGRTTEMFPSLFLLLLIVVSYFFRPADRKPVAAKQ